VYGNTPTFGQKPNTAIDDVIYPNSQRGWPPGKPFYGEYNQYGKGTDFVAGGINRFAKGAFGASAISNQAICYIGEPSDDDNAYSSPQMPERHIGGAKAHQRQTDNAYDIAGSEAAVGFGG